MAVCKNMQGLTIHLHFALRFRAAAFHRESNEGIVGDRTNSQGWVYFGAMGDGISDIGQCLTSGGAR